MAAHPEHDLSHLWLRVERVLRAILTDRWSKEAWQRMKQEYPKLWAERERVS